MHVLISAVSSARQPTGICRHATNLAKSLSGEAAVSRVTLLVGPWQLGYFQSAFGLSKGSVNIQAVDVKNDGLLRNMWYYRTLPQVAQRQEADVVHLTFPAPVQRQRFSCPIACSLHDLYPYDSPRNFGYMRVMFNRAILRNCLRASDAIICSSNFTRDRLRQCAPAFADDKALRIYQSVTLNPDKARTPTNRMVGLPFVLAVAQHRRNKNLHLLLPAFAAMRSRKQAEPQLRLIIVGAEGPETANLHSLVQRLSLQNCVQFESALSDAELCWLYRKCEMMVIASSVEGFCLPVAEAMRCGARVLCSDIPVLREIGESHCCYFKLQCEKPVSALAQAMSETLLKPAIIPVVSGRFSPREVARQHVALYRKLTARKRHEAHYSVSGTDELQSERYAG